MEARGGDEAGPSGRGAGEKRHEKASSLSPLPLAKRPKVIFFFLLFHSQNSTGLFAPSLEMPLPEARRNRFTACESNSTLDELQLSPR